MYRGKEIYVKTFLDFLIQNKTQIYRTKSDSIAVFVERFNRTLLDLLEEPMYIESKACCLNHLDAALEKYKKRVHRTNRMISIDASNDKPITSLITSNNFFSKVQMGDYVRVPDKRSIY